MVSRLQDPHETAGEEASMYNVSYVNYIPVSAINIVTQSRKDTILTQVCKYVMAGWPNHVSDELKLYFMKLNKLSMEQGCLLWGYRVVIPLKFQHVLLKELHNDHSGISQTKSFARSYMWWSNIDICIEEMISCCLICQSVQNNPPAAPLHPWSWATRIWQRVRDVNGIKHTRVVPYHPQ